MMGLGFALVLLALGAVRELLGTGVLFANMQLLFGPMAEHWQLTLLGSDYQGFLLAILPPGAFLVLGLLIAGKNILDARAEARAKARQPAQEPAPSRRVRVTGVVE
ncbi:Electron transport complex protein RnfE [compost metagenome]